MNLLKLHSILIHLLLSFVFFLESNMIFSQNADLVNVINEDNSLLSYPWAGGLNAVQFGGIDLNQDGLEDLVAFDRHGNRKLCFVNNGALKKLAILLILNILICFLNYLTGPFSSITMEMIKLTFSHTLRAGPG